MKRLLALVVFLSIPVPLLAQQPQSPTPADLTNQIEQALDNARKLNDQLRTMVQPCSYAVTPVSFPSVKFDGDTLQVQITTTGMNCAWSAVSADPWAAPSSPSGTDSRTLAVTVSANPDTTARTTILTVAGQIIPVPQDGAPPPPPTGQVANATEFDAALKARWATIRPQGSIVGNWVINYPVSIECPINKPVGRVSPSDVSVGVFTPTDPLKSVMIIATGGDNVTIRGCTFTGVANDRTLFVIGTDKETDINKLPKNTTLIQNAFLGVNGFGHRAIEANGANVTVKWNHIAGFLERGRQSQGFYATNGSGPFLIEDNYIEASGENILFGGSDPAVLNMVPSDIWILNNTLFKLQAWKTQSGSVANLLELKCAQRVVIQGNVMDGNWADIQAGHAIVFTARDQYGKAPWCLVDDVTFRDNIVRNTSSQGSYAVNILGTDDTHPSGQTKRITIDHNLFEDSPNGIQINAGVIQQFVVTRNTFPRINGNWMYFIGLKTGLPVGGYTPMIVQRNVVRSGQYGVFSPNQASGAPTINWWSNGKYTFDTNVIEKTPVRPITWPPNNTLLNPGTLAGQLDANYHYIPDPSLGW